LPAAKLYGITDPIKKVLSLSGLQQLPYLSASNLGRWLKVRKVVIGKYGFSESNGRTIIPRFTIKGRRERKLFQV
jgi:hypothetical protein